MSEKSEAQKPPVLLLKDAQTRQTHDSQSRHRHRHRETAAQAGVRKWKTREKAPV